jgi:hypothetical protein
VVVGAAVLLDGDEQAPTEAHPMVTTLASATARTASLAKVGMPPLSSTTVKESSTLTGTFSTG